MIVNLGNLLEKTALIVPRKIAEAGGEPGSFSSEEIEKVSLEAIRLAIGSLMPDAEARHVGGQKFPDITVTFGGETAGVEIKSTRTLADPWTVPGGSIMEGNRVDGVNDVWLLFTKLAGGVETRARPYADAVSDLAVTHSPRYILSMESGKEESLFARLGVSYDTVRESARPFEFFRDYMGRKARESGGTPWWSERETESVSPPFIRFWEEIGDGEKSALLAEGWALFASDLLFGQARDKYKGFALHLVRRHAIISTSLRDNFTAGGKRTVIAEFGESPRVFLGFANRLCEIRAFVEAAAGDDSRAWDEWKAGLLEAAGPSGDAGLLSEIFRRYS